jgi:hypothetical protein
MKRSLLPLLLIPSVVSAEPCEPVPEVLSVLNDVVASFYRGAEGASAYCPDDLRSAVNIEEADRIATAMDSTTRQLAAKQIGEAAMGLDGENLQAMANAAVLLDALYAAELLAGGEEIQTILDEIHRLADNTADEKIHRQIALNLWRRGAEDAASLTLLEKLLPLKPDYERIFENGRTEIPVKLRTGRDGFAYSNFKDAFDVPGAEMTVIEEDELIRVTYTVQPDDPSIEPVSWIIDIVRSPRTDHFDDMGTDEISVSMFADHSQLGTSLDRALEGRPDESEGSTDFFWVDACKSKVFASQLSQAYPMGHFVFTKDSEYFRDMPVSFERGLVALSNEYNYDEMRRLVAAGNTWKNRNYIFPDDPAKFAYQDQDGDGVTDSEDRLFNFDQGEDDLYPEGELATRAVTIANTYMAYSSAYQYYNSQTQSFVEDDYRPDGVFDGEPGGAATQIETRTDAYGDLKYFVAVSDETLKMEQTQRTASIAAEMAYHSGSQTSWTDDFVRAGAFLVGVSVYDVWYGENFKEYRKKYYPEKELSDYESMKYIDGHNFVTSESIGRLLSDSTDP